MPPHKQNTSRIKQKKPKFEQLQADHEMFLQAFEKPTQIYRFLRTRNQIAPIFMHRTLTYMRKRSARSSKNRPNFNVNSMLLREETRVKTQARSSSLKSDYMNLTFQEFHMPSFSEGDSAESHEPATIEAVLLKICHKKRKDVYTPVLRDSLGQCSLLPSSSGRLYHSPSICIPSSKLSHTNGHTIKSYILLLKVVCPKWVKVQKDTPNDDICNGTTDSQDHPAKRTRRHSGRTPDRTPEKDNGSSRPNSPRAPASPRGPSSPRAPASPRGPSSPRVPNSPRTPNSPRAPIYEGTVSYASELVILDKHQKCHLTDGDYEVSLQEVKSKVRNGSKGASWETLMDGKAVESLENLNSGPLLKFHLEWATKPINISPPSTATAPPISSSSTHNNLSPRSPQQTSAGNRSPASSRKLENGVEPMDTSPSCVKPDAVTNTPHSPMKHALRAQASPPPSTGHSTPTRNAATSTTCNSKTLRVFYQFLYNNNTRQQTEARDNLHCPWCALNCQELYSLLKHLTLCHSRFKFTYVPLPKGARIDVSINEHYDGSYAGNPQNLTSHTGYAFRRNGPCRRTPVTQILVTKPRRPKQHALTEFQEGEDKEYLATRPYISGHNRIYYHTHSLQPMRPQEMNYDSEDEIDPIWLQERTYMMIDEFTDVNEGEKELMKLWNVFCMKYNYITDAHIPMACIQFVQEEGVEVLAKDLTHNLILHFVNLYDFSLIHPTVIARSMAELDKIRKKMSANGVATATPSSPSVMNSETASEGRREEYKEGEQKKDGKSWDDMEESFDDFPSCSTTESTVTSENKSETTVHSGDSTV